MRGRRLLLITQGGTPVPPVTVEPVAKTTATSGVEYVSWQTAVGGASASIGKRALLKSYAKAISNNASITADTTKVYIDDESNEIYCYFEVGDSVNGYLRGGQSGATSTCSYRIIGFNTCDLYDSNHYGEATVTGKAGISWHFYNCTDSSSAFAAHGYMQQGEGVDNYRDSSGATEVGDAYNIACFYIGGSAIWLAHNSSSSDEDMRVTLLPEINIMFDSLNQGSMTYPFRMYLPKFSEVRTGSTSAFKWFRQGHAFDAYGYGSAGFSKSNSWTRDIYDEGNAWWSINDGQDNTSYASYATDYNYSPLFNF